MKTLQLWSRHWDRFSCYIRPGLTIAFKWSVQLKQYFLDHLPRGLTELAITLIETPTDIIGHLPRGLISLKIDHTGPLHDYTPLIIGSLWPQHLKSLEVSSEDETLSFPLLLPLPSQLEHFSEQLLESAVLERSSDMSTTDPFIAFPHPLKTLIIAVADIKWDLPTVRALPSTLMHLETRSGFWTNELVDNLPPLLETVILGESADNKLTPNVLAALAQKPLKVLSVASASSWPWSFTCELPTTAAQVRGDPWSADSY